MRRVAVIGNVGSGKSTLARALAASTGLPYHELDELVGRPQARPPEIQAELNREFIRRHTALIAGPTWVIDGIGIRRTVMDRLEAADTIIHIDRPPWVNFLWAAKRAHGADAPEDRAAMLADLDWIFPYVWYYHSRIRPRLLPELRRLAAQKTVIALKSKAEIDAFLVVHCGPGANA